MTTVEIVTVVAALVGIFGQLMITLRLAYFTGQQTQKLMDHDERLRNIESVQADHAKRISSQAIDIGKLQRDVELLPRRTKDC